MSHPIVTLARHRTMLHVFRGINLFSKLAQIREQRRQNGGELPDMSQ